MPLRNLFYHEYQDDPSGKNPPIVLVHGAGGHHLYWPSPIRRIPNYHVYAIDLPGHGRSGGSGQQTIASYASILVEWLMDIRVHSAVFFGHSMGAAIILSLALDHPDHVLGLGLLGAGATMKVNPDLIEKTSSPTTFFNAVEALVNWSFAAQTPPELVQLASKRLAETRHSVLHGDLVACEAFHVEDRLSSIFQPALVIAGEQDKMMPLRYSHVLVNTMPNSRLVIIPGAGHMMMLEQPQAVLEAMTKFLGQINF
jgi:pimeloyl-ACP methyl ester carboxylesterase